VVIRSIIVNTKSNQLFFAAGGAITHLSDIDEEFEESNLKAKALGEVLNYEIE
jgi:anthranilate/para-aminobenzoate synthase component I